MGAAGLWAIIALVALSRIDKPDRGTPQYERVTGTLQTGNWAIPVLLAFGFVWNGLPGAEADHPSGGVVAAATGSEGGAAADHIAWRYDVADALASAKADGKPVLLYFTADWCLPCKELDHGIYKDAEVIEESQRFVCVKADMTDDSDQVVEGLRVKHRVNAPPVVFIYHQQISGTVLGQIVP